MARIGENLWCRTGYEPAFHVCAYNEPDGLFPRSPRPSAGWDERTQGHEGQTQGATEAQTQSAMYART